MIFSKLTMILHTAIFRMKYHRKLLNAKVVSYRFINAKRSNFKVGSDFFSGPGLYISINKYSNLFIGDAVMFGPDVMILGGNHDYTYNINHLRYNKEHDTHSKDIIIESGVWIAARCTILSGAQICEGVVLGAGSIVSKYLPPYSICLGTPGRVIKSRFDTIEQLSIALKSCNSKYELKEVLNIYENYGIQLR
ncbi:acyltransferase [Pseudoalteromonas undina]|uniref:acyltransferase n=1 Tax=Pseudoalteromonas undina TaxID=43660 RepID=UPI0018669C39|nr:acyltransferase [Pseudoalteromonas undina]